MHILPQKIATILILAFIPRLIHCGRDLHATRFPSFKETAAYNKNGLTNLIFSFTDILIYSNPSGFSTPATRASYHHAEAAVSALGKTATATTNNNLPTALLTGRLPPVGNVQLWITVPNRKIGTARPDMLIPLTKSILKQMGHPLYKIQRQGTYKAQVLAESAQEVLFTLQAVLLDPETMELAHPSPASLLPASPVDDDDDKGHANGVVAESQLDNARAAGQVAGGGSVAAGAGSSAQVDTARGVGQVAGGGSAAVGQGQAKRGKKRVTFASEDEIFPAREAQDSEVNEDEDVASSA